MGTLLQGPSVVDAVARVSDGSGWRYTLLHPEGAGEEIFTLDATDAFSVMGVLDGDLYLAIGNSAPGVGTRGLYRYDGEGGFDFVTGSVHPNWDPQSATEYQGKLYFGSPYGAVAFVFDPDTETLTDIATGITEDDIFVGDVFEGLLFWGTQSSAPRGPGSLYAMDAEENFTLVQASTVTPGDPNPAGSQCRCAVVYNGELWTCFATDVPVTDSIFWSFDAELNPTERATLSGALQAFVHRGELLAGGLAQGVVLRWDEAEEDFLSFVASPGGGAITATQIASHKGALYFGSHVSTILRWREDDPSQPSRIDRFDAIGGGTPNRHLLAHDGQLFLLTRDALRVWRASLQTGDVTQPPNVPQPTFAQLVADRPALVAAGWQADHDYMADLGGPDDAIQLLIPDGSDDVFAAEVYSGFPTGTVEPDWSSAPNPGDSVVEDNENITWYNVGPASTLGDAPTTWAAEHDYGLSAAFVYPTTPNGHLYMLYPGYGHVSTDTEPGFPTDGTYASEDSEDGVYWWDMGFLPDPDIDLPPIL